MAGTEITLESLSDEELARWMCLVEGIDFIYQKFEDMGIPISEIESKKYIKKVDKGLIKYIKERFEAMLYDIQYESKMVNFN